MKRRDGIFFSQEDRDQLEEFVLKYGTREVIYKLSQIEEDLGNGLESSYIVARLRTLWKLTGGKGKVYA